MKHKNIKKRARCKAKIELHQMYLFTMQVGKTIERHFPEFLELLGQVSDHCKRPVYKVEELLMAVVGMFLFKRGSRNHADNSIAKVIVHNSKKLFAVTPLVIIQSLVSLYFVHH